MNPNQRLSRIRPPMTKKPILDVLRLQGLAKQRIRAKIDHSCRQIIAGLPVSIRLYKLVGGKRRSGASRNFICASHSVLRHLKNSSSARMTYFAEYSSNASGSPIHFEFSNPPALFCGADGEGLSQHICSINSSLRHWLNG